MGCDEVFWNTVSIRRPRFHFNNNKGIIDFSDDVDFIPSSSKVPLDDPIALALQEHDCSIFASFAERFVVKIVHVPQVREGVPH